MKLSDLLIDIDFEGNVPDLNISALCHDSRRASQGSLFFVLTGANLNGEQYIDEAISRGAVCIVTFRRLDTINKTTQIVVHDVRLAMSLIAKNFFKGACDSLEIIGVVGTNGKTTCTQLLAYILKENGKKVASIGTLGVQINGKIEANGMTTPDPIELHNYFKKMRDAGITHVVMEVSAHAIYYKKIAGIRFACVIFTNITPDHLDFFVEFEKYRDTKIDFICLNCIDLAIVNTDCEAGQLIKSLRTCKTLSYGENSDCDYVISNIELEKASSRFKIGETSIAFNMPARFNVLNASACFICAQNLGLSEDGIVKSLANSPLVPGRFNAFNISDFTAVIDFAHTPDSLEKFISSSREFCQGKIITVFGCGGNRDTIKRPIMGGIASKLSDFVVITSDNPRFEKPREIARQIESGICTDNYKVILNRASAIKWAFKLAKKGDVVLVAGKGAENYIERNGKKKSYSDYETVMRLAKKLF